MRRRLTVSVDKNADLKALKRLEAEGLVELFAVAIEGLEDTRKLKNKELPIAVFDSPFARIDRCAIAADDTPLFTVQRILGKHNHGDCLHLERHIRSGRDVFVTDDNDFLSCRDQLSMTFGVTILTVNELKERVAGQALGEGAL